MALNPGLALVGSAAAGTASAVLTAIPILIRPERKVGPFRAMVTIEEEHHDELVITQHPVDQGAQISDHAYKQPASLRLHLGWSDSASIENLFSGFTSVKQVYAQLQRVQDSRIPITVLTGKRAYKNMLIRTMTTRTDKRSENALFVTLDLQQIIRVATQTSNVAASQADQAAPKETGVVTDLGTQQPRIPLSSPPDFVSP